MIVILDWRQTAYAQKPSSGEVWRWLKAQGFHPMDTPRVYANGQVQVELAETDVSPEAIWASFMPVSLTVDDQLAAHIAELVASYKLLSAVSHPTPEQRALLATMALLAYGYGVALSG